MSEITDCFACRGCRKKEDFMRDVVKDGKKGNVLYVVKKSQIKYMLEPINMLDGNLVTIIDSEEFTDKFIPKFGKAEIEAYIAEEFKTAILVTHDLTDLFCTTIMCDGIIVEGNEIATQLQTRLDQIKTDLQSYTYRLDYNMLNRLCVK